MIIRPDLVTGNKRQATPKTVNVTTIFTIFTCLDGLDGNYISHIEGL